MKTRRAIIGGAAVGLLPLAAPSVVRAQKANVRWRLASSYPKNLDTIHGIAVRLAKHVAEMTDGGFHIQVLGPGEVVPGLQVLDAVQNETVEIGHTASIYYSGKNKAFAIDTGLPFGMTPRQHLSWMYRGGGLELFREFFKTYGIVNFPGGSTGVQMGGWFRREVNTLNDLKGLKMRIPGISGDVVARLGVVPQNIAGGDTYPALERGTIDAVEWVGPYDDEKLGFNKVAKYYYYPGWWDCTGQLAFYVGANAWSALPPQYQRVFEVAAAEASWDMLSHYDASNMAPLRRLIASGTELRPFSREIMEGGYRAAFSLYTEEAEKNPEFRKIYGEWRKFREDIVTWFRVAEASFESNLYSLYKS